MEINAIALPTAQASRRNRFALWAAEVTNLGEINFANATDLVLQVTAKTRSEQNFSGITRLNIMSHGNSRGTALGSDFVTVHNFSQFELTLSHLQHLFARNGFAHLQACRVGNAYELLRRFARVWRVPIYAATANYIGWMRIQVPWGDYVRCEPNGTCQVGVGRP
jgi:hypothetical protein